MIETHRLAASVEGQPWLLATDLLLPTAPAAPTAGGCPSLVHLPEPVAALVCRVGADGTRSMLVRGPRTSAAYNVGPPIAYAIRLRIRPGYARQALGPRGCELADVVAPLRAVWGDFGAQVEDGLGTHGDDPERIAALMTSAVAQRPGRLAMLTVPRPLRTALRALSLPAPTPSIQELADHLGLSERRLRSLFADEVGLSPRRWARIARLRRALADIGRSVSWSQIAATSGYFDQAHLIRDFRSMMGVTPTAFRAGRWPIPEPC